MRLTKRIQTLTVNGILVIGLFFTTGTLSAQSNNYSCGSYGANSYSSETCGSTSPGNSTGLIERLSSTGEDNLPYTIGGSILVLGGLILLAKARKKHQSA